MNFIHVLKTCCTSLILQSACLHTHAQHKKRASSPHKGLGVVHHHHHHRAAAAYDIPAPPLPPPPPSLHTDTYIVLPCSAAVSVLGAVLGQQPPAAASRPAVALAPAAAGGTCQHTQYRGSSCGSTPGTASRSPASPCAAGGIPAAHQAPLGLL